MAIDPGTMTVDEVKSWVTDNWHDHRNDPSFVAVHNAERDGKARVSLLDWLDHFAEDHSIDVTPAVSDPDPGGVLIGLMPSTAETGQPPFDLFVVGNAAVFTVDSVIILAGGAVPTTFVDDTHLSTQVGMAASAGTFPVWVDVSGDGEVNSQQAIFTFTDPVPETHPPLTDDEVLTRQLTSWGLTGEPIGWAPTRMQPSIYAIRAANKGFGTVDTVQGILDISYPLNHINADDVCLPIPVEEPTVKATKGSDGRFHLVTEDQGVPVTWFVDGSVVGEGAVLDAVLEPGEHHVLAQVSVAGEVWTKDVVVEGAEVIPT